MVSFVDPAVEVNVDEDTTVPSGVVISLVTSVGVTDVVSVNLVVSVPSVESVVITIEIVDLSIGLVVTNVVLV